MATEAELAPTGIIAVLYASRAVWAFSSGKGRWSRRGSEIIVTFLDKLPLHQTTEENYVYLLHPGEIPTGSPSRDGDVAVYVLDIKKKPSLLTPVCSVLVSISVFMALSTGCRSINSPDDSPLSHSVLLILFLPYWSFQLYISVWKSPSALI